jgi:hypothetical protein
MVIRANGSEKITNSAVAIGRYLIQKTVRRQKTEALLRKEKQAATFSALEDNLVSSGPKVHGRASPAGFWNSAFKLTYP